MGVPFCLKSFGSMCKAVLPRGTRFGIIEVSWRRCRQETQQSPEKGDVKMGNPAYTFDLTAYDMSMLPQVSSALEKRTELASREKLPGMWKMTDRLSDGSGKTVPGQGRGRGIVFLVLGALLFVTGLMQSGRLTLVAVAGAVAMLWGALRVLGSLPRRESRFDRAARELLADKSSLPAGQLRVVFSDEGMVLSSPDGGNETVPYSALDCAIETPDLYFLEHDSRGTLLQKRDLSGGNNEGFRAFLKQKVNRYVQAG